MNASTHTEIQAIATQSALEIATPATNLILVPLSQLRRSPASNVRRTGGLSIEDIAASIERVGLLQNLCVIAPASDDCYEVVAGGRRLAALQLLAQQRRISMDWEVPCLLVADGSARTVSLVENVQREAMHPADQFEAFAALVADGRSVEGIAADFGVSPTVVQRRLKLANVSARLIADYRADAVSLEQLMALAITDDHEAQIAAFYDAPEWQRDPSTLRARLTERDVAATHALARFVGLEAYEAAGGPVRRDLFAEDEEGVYLTDASLLQMLAVNRLDSYAATVRKEGWVWVDVTPHVTYSDLQAFRRAPTEQRTPTQREAQRIENLKLKIEEIDQAIEQAVDTDDEDKADELQEEAGRLNAELNTLEEALQDFSAETRAMAGAIVTVDRQGEIAVHRGLVREADAKALRGAETRRRNEAAAVAATDEGGEGSNNDGGGIAHLSDRLAQRLSAHRTAALQIELARHPHVAMATLAHGMVQSVIQDGHFHRDLPIGVRVTVQDRLEAIAPDWPDSPAAVALRALRQEWRDKLPGDSAELFATLLAMAQDDLVRLLAVCTSTTVDAVTHHATYRQPGAEIARAVGLDMAHWWKPSAEGYFRHIAKAEILQAVSAYAPDQTERLSKLKKAEIASEAERLAQACGWMPNVFGETVDAQGKPENDGEPSTVDATAILRSAATATG